MPSTRPRPTALFAAVLAAAVLTASPAVAGVEDDAAVVEADRRAAEAEARVREAIAALDEAAAAYELTAAQHERLVAELDGTEQTVERAEAQVDGAEDALAGRLIELYRRPYETFAVAEALAVGEDVAGTLHAAALLEHAAQRGVDEVAQARLAGDLTFDGVRQQHTIAAGTRAAAEARRAAADTLARSVAGAEQALEEARAGAAAARTASQERLEAERLEAERLAAERSLSFGPPPVVDGRVCPIGGPNGFGNSWGAPRSGGRRHQGVDIFAAHGMPLYAVAEGTVTRVGTGSLGGLSVWLADDRGDSFYYAHLSGVAVSAGDRVVAGQVVGYNGDSGNARGTPPHLHWQHHPGGGAAVNPYPLAMALCRAG